MKRMLAVVLALALVAFLGVFTSDATAQTLGKSGSASFGPHGPVDSDGDGIPNHDDPDFKKPQDGTGNKFGKAKAMKGGLGKGNGMGQRLGAAAGTGAGMGMGTGTGVCDGTGPKGRGRGR